MYYHRMSQRLIGAIMLAALGNGLTPLGVREYVGDIIKGALMILGIAVIALSKYRLHCSAK